MTLTVIISSGSSTLPEPGSPRLILSTNSIPSIEGMEFVDKIKRGEPGSGSVDDPDEMITVRVISDL